MNSAAPKTIDRAQFDEAYLRHHDLNFEGFGRPTHIPAGTWALQVPAAREALRNAFPEVRDCAWLLSQAPPSRRPTNSYSLKHNLERLHDAVGCPRHISNGAVILAADLAGLTVRRTRGLDAMIDIHPDFLSGALGGLPYRVPVDESKVHQIDAWVERLARLDRAGRGVPATQLADGFDGLADVDAALMNLRNIVASDGRYVALRRGRGFPRWIANTIDTPRPLDIALTLHLRALDDELTQTIDALRASPRDLPVDVVRAVDASLREVVDAFRAD
jgi:hypothetical protein